MRSTVLLPHPFNSRKRVPTPCRVLMLANHHIPSTDTAKFLGIIVDNKLSWKAQGMAILAEGQDWLLKFGRIANTSKGIHTKYFCQLYLATAIPHILYATDMFLTPQQHVGKRSTKGSRYTIINKLTILHRKVAILITRTLKSTATDALNTLANLPPLDILIEQHRHNTALHLVSLPSDHPLHKPITNAADRLVKCHPTPLHNLLHRSELNPTG